ncbi:hypothetical protein D3C72_937930 [compost metagenome]
MSEFELITVGICCFLNPSVVQWCLFKKDISEKYLRDSQIEDYFSGIQGNYTIESCDE